MNGHPVWIVRSAGGGQESGVVVVAALPDTTAVLTAGHVLPVEAGVWDRVVELMASVERAQGEAPFVLADLGFALDPPALPWISFEPGRVRFTTAKAGDSGPRYSASLVPGAVLGPEQDAYCEPAHALELAFARERRVLAHHERDLAGARGCEVAAVSELPGGARVFEYVAFGFFADRRAEIRMRAPVDAAESLETLLERARAFAHGFTRAR
jgi:hypothetical protein